MLVKDATTKFYLTSALPLLLERSPPARALPAILTARATARLSRHRQAAEDELGRARAARDRHPLPTLSGAPLPLTTRHARAHALAIPSRPKTRLAHSLKPPPYPFERIWLTSLAD